MDTQLAQELEEARTLLMIDPTWRVNVKMTDRPGGHEWDGATRADASYMIADQEYANSLLLESPDYRRRVLIHELLHVQLAEMDATFQRAIDLLPKNEASLIEGEYHAATERFCQRLSRGLSKWQS